MPTKVLTISNFSGGANSKTEPSSIKDNEAVSLVSLVPSRQGKLRLAGRFVNANVIGDADLPADGADMSESTTIIDNDAIRLDASLDHLQNSGYGLFYFNHEKTSISATNTLIVNGSPTQVDGGIDYWVVQDNKYVKIYDSYSGKWLQTRIDIGTSGTDSSDYPYVKPIYFFAENALRATSAPVVDTTFQRRWFGYIERTLFDGNGTSYDKWVNHKRWHIDTAKILAPSASSYSQALGSESPGKMTNEVTTNDTFTGTSQEGVVLCLKRNDSGSSGTWLDKTYTFYGTYIYDGSQESNAFALPNTLASSDKKVVYAGVVVSYSDNDDAASTDTDGSIVSDGIEINPRITGGRFYFSDPDDGDGILYHLMDFDFQNGCRKVGEEAWTTWDDIHEDANHETYECPDAVIGGVAAAGFKFEDPPKFVTYETINGYKPFESLDASYSTIAIVGKRAYIGNVIINGVRHNDRIMRSPINFEGKPQYDTFPESHFIDIGADDGDAIVKLLAAGDKLIVYKTSSTSVYNVGKFGGEFVEHVFYYNGIKHPTQAVNTVIGPVWVNPDGCWIYNNGQIKNLIEDKLVSSDDIPSYASRMKWSINDNDPKSIPSIGYLPKQRQLIVGLNIHKESTINNDCWIYSFDTNAWSLAINSLQTRGYTSNFINSRTGQLYALSSAYSVTDGGTEYVFDGESDPPADSSDEKLGAKQLFVWDSTSAKKSEMALVTKEINFKDENLIKKIYKIGLTFKTDAATNIKPYYAINGSDTIIRTFESSKGLLNSDGVIEADASASPTQKATSYSPGYWTPKYNGTATVTHLTQTLLSDSTFSSGWSVAGDTSIDSQQIYYDYDSENPGFGSAAYTIGTGTIIGGQQYTLTFVVSVGTAAITIKDSTGSTTIANAASYTAGSKSITFTPAANANGIMFYFSSSVGNDTRVDDVVLSGPVGCLIGLWNNSSTLQLLKLPGGIITHIAGYKANVFQPPSIDKMIIKFNSFWCSGGGGKVRLLCLGGNASLAVDVTAMATYDSNNTTTYPTSIPLKGLGAGEISSDSVEIFEGVSYELETVYTLSTLHYYVLVFTANELSTSDYTGFGISGLSITDAGHWMTGLIQPSSPISCKSIQIKLEGTGTQDTPADVPANFELRSMQIYYRPLRPKIVPE